MYPLNLAIAIANQSIWNEVQSVLHDRPLRLVLELAETGDTELFAAKLERARPDVLLFDLSAASTAADELIRKIRAILPGTPVIALAPLPDPNLILSAMRAGATEFLYLPMAAELTAVLERIGAELNRHNTSSGKQGKVLACLSAKGGSGATTVACHVAAELARQTRQETLLMDLDLQTGMLGFLMKTKSVYSVLDAITNVHRLDASYFKGLVSNGTPGLEVISAPPPLTSQAPVRREQLHHVLRFVRSQYEWTVADLGRSLTPLTLTALEEVDETLLITTPEIPALHQAQHIIQKLANDGLHRRALRVVINRMPKDPDITIGDLEKLLGTGVYMTLPNDYPALNGSYTEGKLLEGNTRLGRSFTQLAARLAGLEEQKGKKKFAFFG